MRRAEEVQHSTTTKRRVSSRNSSLPLSSRVMRKLIFNPVLSDLLAAIVDYQTLGEDAALRASMLGSFFLLLLLSEDLSRTLQPTTGLAPLQGQDNLHQRCDLAQNAHA